MEKGVWDSILRQAQMGQYRLERPVLGLCLPSMEPSLPLRGVQKLLKPRAHGPAGRAEPRVRPRGGRSRLTCFPPPGWGGAGGGAATQPVDGQAAARPTFAGTGRGPAGGPEAGCERESKLGERSDLGAGGGVARGGGGSERPPERGWPRKRRAPPTHPGRERRSGRRQAGPGAAGPSPPTVTPQPPARAQDDEEAAASHAAAGPDGQLGTVSVSPRPPSPALTRVGP